MSYADRTSKGICMPLFTNQLRRLLAAGFLAFLSLLLLSGNFAVAAIDVSERTWDNLYDEGLHQFDVGNLTEAESLLRTARDMSNGDTSKYCATLEALFSVYTDQKNNEAAEGILLEYLKCVRAGKELASSREAVILSQLAALNSAMKKYDRAENFSRAAVPLVQRFYGYSSPEMASELNNLGCSELRQNKLDSAEQHILEAINILEKTLGRSSTPYGLAALNMAEIYELRQNSALSIVWYRRAMSTFDETLGSNNSLSQKIAQRCKTLKLSRQATNGPARPQREERSNAARKLAPKPIHKHDSNSTGVL